VVWVDLVSEIWGAAADYLISGATLPGHDPVGSELDAQLRALITGSGFGEWARQIDNAGHCEHPVRLRGRLHRLNAATGVLSPVLGDRELLVRCGNRRAAVCQPCSFTYAGDVWHLIHAGITGDRYGMPPQVAAHPMVFVTLTAPGFGLVHTTRVSRSGIALPCRPRRSRDRRPCPHERPAWCQRVHDDTDAALGEPLCEECFDYEAAAWFNHCAPELWCRFTIALRRALAAHLRVTEAGLREQLVVQYAKVAEFQRRGVIHFHAVVRVDGPGPGHPVPTLLVSHDTLVAAIRDAADDAWLRLPAWREGRPGLRLRFGAQLDIRPVIRTSIAPDAGDDLAVGELTGERVAAYIAKYATKGADDFGLHPRIRTVADLDRLHVSVSHHVRRFLAMLEGLAVAEPAFWRWFHMLGFGGHFTTKSRTYSTTLTALRRQRRSWRQGQTPDQADTFDELQDDDTEATTLVIRWALAGIGHRTAAEAALAAAAAARARERREDRTRQRNATYLADQTGPAFRSRQNHGAGRDRSRVERSEITQ
jgi:hypothetical protein